MKCDVFHPTYNLILVYVDVTFTDLMNLTRRSRRQLRKTSKKQRAEVRGHEFLLFRKSFLSSSTKNVHKARAKSTRALANLPFLEERLFIFIFAVAQ